MNVNITTAQNVEIGQIVASVGERMLAQVIDFLLFGVHGSSGC
ncbi:MAG: hypothetical protein ACOCW8_01290 [bacterium]